MLAAILLVAVTTWATGHSQVEPVLCKIVVWIGHKLDDRVRHCWNMTGGSNWYGGGTREEVYWPLQSGEGPSFESATTGARDGATNSIHSRFWMSSSGLAIIADDDVPLSVSTNAWGDKDLLCLQAFKIFPYHYPTNVPPKLSYAQCETDPANMNMTSFYLYLRQSFFRLPEDIPDPSLFHQPFWTTKPRFVRPKSSDILAFAANISTFMARAQPNSASNGILHIHDWQVCEGGLQFVSSKIPNPGSLFSSLSSFGLRVALQIHPFINQNCNGFETVRQRGFLVLNSTNKPALGAWMGEPVYTIDFTNEDAVSWWASRLKSLQTKYAGVSFVFDGGVSSSLPRGYNLSGAQELQPDLFTTRFVEAAAAFGRVGVITSGWRTQHLPIFVRSNRMSNVGSSGFGSIGSEIPNVMLAGLLGYPFVMPEIVGGTYDYVMPDKYVYIRWLQLAIFLPALHMSFGPWDYDSEVVDIAFNMLQLRTKYENYLVEVARQATVDGSPIIRPLWWAAPNDKTAQVINDQFLVGNMLLVAPVIDTSKDKHIRDIYLPEGKWRDENAPEITFIGPRWLWNHTALIHQIPHFSRL